MPVNDPHEGFNRHVMAANQEALRPVAELVKTLPGPVHDRVHDFNVNLKEPRILVNTILQGRPTAAAQTAMRFVVNTVIGFGGFIDLASQAGLPQQSGDFGQTLFVWGVPEGTYVVRPYLGPATQRDAFGSVVDMLTNPVGLALAPVTAITLGSAGVDAVDRLGQFKMAEDASIDFYSFIRSSYYQLRRNELREALGQPPVVDSPALDDPDAPAAPPPAATNSAAAGGTPGSAPTRSASADRAAHADSASHASTPGTGASRSAAERPAPAAPARALSALSQSQGDGIGRGAP